MSHARVAVNIARANCKLKFINAQCCCNALSLYTDHIPITFRALLRALFQSIFQSFTDHFLDKLKSASATGCYIAFTLSYLYSRADFSLSIKVIGNGRKVRGK